MSGRIRINGEEVTKRQLRLCSAYVQQDDLFMSTLTVTEHLMFNVRLETIYKLKIVLFCTGDFAYGPKLDR